MVQAEDGRYRGFVLSVVQHPPVWQVSIVPTQPNQTGTNLPLCQHTDRARAIDLAKASVDLFLDGPALGELGAT